MNDSDLIGTHFRYQQMVPLTDWMAGEGIPGRTGDEVPQLIVPAQTQACRHRLQALALTGAE